MGAKIRMIGFSKKQKTKNKMNGWQSRKYLVITILGRGNGEQSKYIVKNRAKTAFSLPRHHCKKIEIMITILLKKIMPKAKVQTEC